MRWSGNGWKYETSSTEAQKFGQIVLQALEVPLPCTCQHHLGEHNLETVELEDIWQGTRMNV